ncbi:hypothetical protein GUJ93_ZPchr0294g2701 [Zizania palustris]|uniref:Uncharacterized protein n=1 Tax=Zizania palustris TaxID=103762 RepID=A0A8J5X6E2_ZIZPA|nr:hypothetical protein GUJ93_ZPchr0294g2701 [Zizania palustris]
MAPTHAVVHSHHVPRRRQCVRRRGIFIRSAAAAAASSVVPTDTLSAAFWDYNLLFRSQRDECPDPVPLGVTEGAIPPDFPAGTYYLTGPGMFSDDHGSTVHPLDGHGYLRSFRFHPGRQSPLLREVSRLRQLATSLLPRMPAPGTPAHA